VTKVGRYLVPAGAPGRPPRVRAQGSPFNPVLDYARDGVLRSLDQSMHRLHTSRIDLVYIHDVDAHSQGSAAAAEAAYAAATAGALPLLQELKREGVIGAIGVGLNQTAWAERWVRETEIDAVMVAGRCTLLNREAEASLIPTCAARGVAYVAAGAFNGGLLARRAGTSATFNYRPVDPAVGAAHARLEALAAEHGVGLPAAAVQFVLRNPHVAALVIGAATVAEVEANCAALAVRIPDAFWAAVEAP